MKTLFFLLTLVICYTNVNSQSTLPLRADTVTIEKIGGSANLKLKDITRDSTGGLYVNIGGGVLRAIKTKKINDTTYTIGLDTIRFNSGSSGSGSVNTRYSITKGTNDSLQLVNDVITPNKWRFYGADINDSSKGFHEIEENFLGILYNKNSWSDLSGFTTNLVTASIVSNKIQVTPAINGIFSCYLAINNIIGDSVAFTNLQKWKATLRVTVDEKTGTSYGFGIGMKSYNTYGLFNGLGRFAAYSGGGELYLTGGHDSVTLNTSSRKLSFSASDKVLLTVERDGGYITTSVRNLTTNSTAIDTSYYYSYSSSPYMPNTGKFTIWAFGGQFTIDSICISSNEVKNARAGIVGNSKEQGYNTSGYAQTTPAMVNTNFKTTILHAGGSDRTIDVARSIKQILALRPQQIILVDLMSNDIRQGGQTTGQIYARYDSIVTVLLNAGIDVYHAPLYESSIDLSGANAHIVSTYSASKILPTYEVMQASGMLGVDGVHPTDAGNIALYNAIVQCYKLYGGNNRYGSSGGAAVSGTTGFLPKFTSSSTIGNSAVSESATMVVSSKNYESPGLSLNNSSGSTNEKLWNQFPSGSSLNFTTVNDARSTNTNWMTVSRSGTTPTSINLLTNTTIQNSSGIGLDITPIGNASQIRITGNVGSNYVIPTNFSVSADGGLFGNYINTSSSSSAHAEIVMATAGSGSGDPFTAYRNSSNNFEWAAGQQISSAEYHINSGTFPGVSGGTNRFRISSSGAITFNNAFTFPTADGTSGQVLRTNGSGTVSWQTPSTGITTINSQTGSTQTIAAGTGISVNSSGDVHTISINSSYITSGTYTPTITNVSNVGASTAYQCAYFMIGNEVHVKGKVDIDPTATGTFLLGISLPISSSFGNDFECAGNANCGAVENLHGAIRADATNDRAEMQVTIPTAGSITNNSWYFEFTYTLIGG